MHAKVGEDFLFFFFAAECKVIFLYFSKIINSHGGSRGSKLFPG